MTTSTFHRSSNSAPSVTIARTGRRDGDFHPRRLSSRQLRDRQRLVADLPWTVLDHVHGNDVVRIAVPGASGMRADGAITDLEDAVLSVWVGDCAPIVLIGERSEIAVLHAGWRGLAVGIVDRAVAAFREPVEQVLVGPTIGPCCNEFGRDDALRVAEGVHAPLTAITVRRPRSGRLESGEGDAMYLDLPAAVAAACAFHGIPAHWLDGCTGCSAQHFSHRVRREPQRHAVAVWQTKAAS